jgi:hypothetical protein
VAYIAAVGALAHVFVVVLGRGEADLEFYWTLWTIVYAPAALAALLAAWYAWLPPRGALALLGFFLALICAAMLLSFAYFDTGPGLVTLALLAGGFFLVAQACRAFVARD